MYDKRWIAIKYNKVAGNRAMWTPRNSLLILPPHLPPHSLSTSANFPFKTQNHIHLTNLCFSGATNVKKMYTSRIIKRRVSCRLIKSMISKVTKAYNIDNIM